MMFCRKIFLICLLLALLLFAGCDSATNSAPWSLIWASSPDAAQSNTPAYAYAACARTLAPGGVAVQPAVSTWLATGSQPRIGLALAQLNRAASFFAIGVVTIDSGSNRWTLTDSGSITRPSAGSGVPATQEAGKAWHLPAGGYNSITLEVPDTPPDGSVQLWISDSNQVFVLARLNSIIQPPTVYTSVTLSGQSGWVSTQGRFTIVTLRLTTGNFAGLGTLIFAGTTGLQQSEQLAAQAAANLNDILPA